MLDLVLELKTKNKGILKEEEIFVNNVFEENIKEKVYYETESGFYYGTMVLTINEYTQNIEQDIFKEYNFDCSLINFLSLDTWNGSNGDVFILAHNNNEEILCAKDIADVEENENDEEYTVERLDLEEYKNKIEEYKKIIEKLEGNKELKNELKNIISILELFVEDSSSEIAVSYF
jgi:hypothetical protein